MTRFAVQSYLMFGMGSFLCLAHAAYSQSATVPRQAASPTLRPVELSSPTPTPPPPRRLFRGGIFDLRDFIHNTIEAPVEHPPLPAPAFNPDPGGAANPSNRMLPEPMSLFDDEPMYPPPYQPPPIPPGLKLPRLNVRETQTARHQFPYRKYPPNPELPPYTR